MGKNDPNVGNENKIFHVSSKAFTGQVLCNVFKTNGKISSQNETPLDTNEIVVFSTTLIS